MPRPATKQDLAYLYTMLAFQFGGRAPELVAALADKLEVARYAGGGPRAFFADGEPLFYVNPKTGFVTLSAKAAKLVFERIEPGRLRVVVDKELFLKHARGSVLAPMVKMVTSDVRRGDEVFIVSESDELLALGKALVSAADAMKMKRGEVAKIRRRLV